MKIIRVEIYNTKNSYPYYVKFTHGYYSEDYDIKQAILSALESMKQQKDLANIEVYEVSVNVNLDEKKITEKYINYDVDSDEYEIR